MQSMLSVVALIVLLARCSSAYYSPVKLSSLQPNKLTVNLTYMIDGATVSPSSVCTQQAPGSACLPKPHAERDSVMIQYGVMSQYQVNSSDTVLLKACYSSFSRVNRPWRALNDVIAKSKACPFVIKNGLNPSSGNVTWRLPETVPIATYFIRALVYAKNASDSANPNAVAIGDSKGFFEVIPINPIEKGLKVASGICICVGPLLFTGFMLYEFKIKKI